MSQLPDGFRPIAEAQFVPIGTEAILLMDSGRKYKATWTFRGLGCAWWPDDKRRQSGIGLYEPVAFKVTREAGAEIVLIGVERRKRGVK